MTRSGIIIAGSSAPGLSRLKALLEPVGHRVSEAAGITQILKKAAAGQHDVLIVESAAEGMCGYQLVRAIRPVSDLGIILLIPDNDRQTRIDALESGADDYIVAPFLPAELLARVRALLRRVAPVSSRTSRLELSGRIVDLQTRDVTGPDRPVAHLTPKEFGVLQFLMAHPNEPVSNQKLASALWQRDSNGDFEYLRVVIGQLRRKLEPDPENPRHIVTDRSLGYRLRIHPTTDDAETSAVHAPLRCVPRLAQSDIQAMVQ
jgi:two-component system KDP operon response regulator KdpE